MKRITTRAAAVLAAAASATALAATLTGAASASALPKPQTAVTHITGRPDSGGGGTWATDKFTRTLTLTYLGKSGNPADPYLYEAQVADTGGSFLNIPGALAPNQGGSHAGQVMGARQVQGTMSGGMTFAAFDTSAKAHMGLVPSRIGGALNANAAYATSAWPMLAFAPGTTETGLAPQSWGWVYNVPASKPGVKPVVKAQSWADTSLDNAGQAQHDGQINGARA